MPVDWHTQVGGTDERPAYRPPGRPKRNRAQINARRRAARRNR